MKSWHPLGKQATKTSVLTRQTLACQTRTLALPAYRPAHWPRASCVKQNTVWLLVNLSPGTSSLPAKVLGILGFVEVESSYMNAVPDLLKGCSSLAIGESMPNSSDSLSGSERRTCHERDRGFGLAHARVPAFPPQPRASTMRCCLCMTRGHNLL